MGQELWSLFLLFLSGVTFVAYRHPKIFPQVSCVVQLVAGILTLGMAIWLKAQNADDLQFIVVLGTSYSLAVYLALLETLPSWGITANNADE